MKLNFNKSKHIRVGKRYKEKVVSPTVKFGTIMFSTELKCLGSTFMSGLSLKCNFHNAKGLFFGSLNSILGKLGTAPPEALVLSLTSSNCLPILSRGIQACNMTKSQIANLSFVDNSVYVKTFSTFHKSVIDYCRFSYRLPNVPTFI